MDKLILKNSDPLIMKWTVKYDEVYGMPQYVYGRLVNEYKGKDSMSEIFVRDIESLDLLNKSLVTYSGDKYTLVGKGKTMLVLNSEEPAFLFESDDDPVDPDDIY